jgi:hypothetical protein
MTQLIDRCFLFLSKSDKMRCIWSLYKQDAKDLHDKLSIVYKAFQCLPQKGQFERLPFFAQRISGNLWRMDRVSYESSISNKDISSRLAKLDAIKSIELEGTIERMKEKKMAGYQEGLVTELVRDILEA